MNRCGYIIIVCCLLSFVAGCGRKTPPIPPQAAIPKAITDLSVQLDDQGAVLSWTYPTLSVSGAKLERVWAFELYKSALPADTFCPECPVHFETMITLPAGSVEPGDKMTYRDSDLKANYQYTYKIVASSGWNIASSDSNRVSFLWEQPLPPPAGLRLQSGDRQLTISWQPVTTLQDGSPISFSVRYQVYRSSKGKEFTPLGAPVDGLSYVDQGLANRRTYYYQVRAVRLVNNTELVGEPSMVVSGEARSQLPPEPPEKFTVVPVDGGVKILWENVAQPGVAGFRIYRREAGEREFQLVGETGRASFSFVDRNLPAGVETFYYAVSAIDDEVPPHESALSREIEYRR